MFAEGTSVPAARTRGEIEALIEKYGGSDFSSGWSKADGARVGQISFVCRGRLVRFSVREPTLDDGKTHVPRRYTWQSVTDQQAQRWVEGEVRRRWRCMLLLIKAKLEAVSDASGITEFDQEFLAHIVGKEGMTVFEWIKMQEREGRNLLPAVLP